MVTPNKNIHVELSEILDLISRIDERVKILSRKEELLQPKCEAHTKELTNSTNKIISLDYAQKETNKNINILKEQINEINLILQELKIETTRQESKWKNIMSFAIQLMWVILASYLLMKTGIQAPAVP
jgi:chromosome segregation ATPase